MKHKGVRVGECP